jgi:hypothetical protein
MLSLLAEYGNDERVTLIQAAASTHRGLIRLNVTDDAVSTSDVGEFMKWRDTANYRGACMVPKITPEEIADTFGGFDFVNIDVEGQSAEYFLRMLALGQFPTVVCCEHDGRLHDILGAATKEHYKAVLVNSTNVVMVR